jgi:hypothetical protein
MIRTQKIKCQQCKRFIIFLFLIEKNENARIEHQLDINILLYVNRDKLSMISRRKHPVQEARTIDENDDEKEIA